MTARVGDDTVPDWLPEPSALSSGDYARGPSSPAGADGVSHVSLDLATLFRSLGMQGLHASVVDFETMDIEAAWTVTERGEVVQDPSGRLPDASSIPGGAALAAQLAHTAAEETVVQKLGPRRWTFAWRLDSRRFLAAEVRYRYGRNEAREMDTALVRLMCGVGLQQSAALAATGDDEDESSAAHAAHAVQGNAGRAHAERRRLLLPALASATAATLLGGWLTLFALPSVDQQAQAVTAEAVATRRLVEGSMTQRVAAALSTGDYGAVQEEMVTLERLGYFRAAFVTNERSRVVATVGTAENIRVGIELPGGTVPNARIIELRSPRQAPLGKLVLVAATLGDGAGIPSALAQWKMLLPAATLLSLVAAMTTGLALRR